MRLQRNENASYVVPKDKKKEKNRNQEEKPCWKNRDAASPKNDDVSQPIKCGMRRLNAPQIHNGKVKSKQNR